tara:strand:- start:198 stop:476 length:279 start_codon:yes stop_codon:yes gene_type:complete
MTLLELMQMSGQDNVGIAKADIKRAFVELESMYPDNVEQAITDILDGQRFYSIPGDGIQVLDVRIKYEEDGITMYRSIPRLRGKIEVEEDGI